MALIPYGKQHLSEQDYAAVLEVLKSDYLTQGPQVPAFEAAVAELTGAAHAVAVNSATSALHLACLALELGPGDRLWTSPITFVASANCGRYCGAEVDFVDIDPNTRNLCPKQLAKKLAQAAATHTLPKVLVVVHMAGASAPMAEIAALAKRYQVAIIEDASHAMGAHYQEAAVGGCQYSDISVFSFHPVKVVTAGEAGVATTQNATLAKALCQLRSHGITRDAEDCHAALPPWGYEQHALGMNYRLSDIHAALGRSQLTQLRSFIARRFALAERYHQALADLPVKRPVLDPESAWHLYLIELEHADTRRAVFEAMCAQGIGVNVHYIPVHTQPYYQALGFEPGDFPLAEQYYAGALTLPLYPDLTKQQQDTVIAALQKAIEDA
ncbi:UDP-4-amino-4,6-dideoxy-N-acetyl-beta-L-altrosamine transaminase [Salinivibrio proteolyticus]|uniref:UDP-4-amino-4, 6-dideoxy-N-acetyl-beta-L-altrosamine transaminase n=1 Tax=Salinivibrio proteolyticus TaxID=334715 RepID=A0ABY7L9V2_9GAMM|nr:UDP-4-amino-4,6-dideoxy-N-acetyl-beta-L-altrosamine transaminase [Salinivibrio proteolyticus]WBA14030.1 UDP-4-amino-4,6-dideoxy-N-acetyl-beta-L-altrosamine transaminase [Salinivibrio proteolyticus]